MSGTQVQMVLNNLQRALLAEEKQGFTNTGVLGGFNAFLRGILPRLEQLFPDHDMDLLRNLAMQYPTWSPLRRREAFSELRRFMQEIMLEAQEFQAQNVPLNVDKAHPVDLIKSQEIPIEKALKGSNLVSLQAKPLQYLKGVGPERAKQLERLGIHNVLDLLQYYPRRYEDRRKQTIAELQEGEMATIAGKVVAGTITNGKLKVVKLSIDQQGRLFQATWFNQIHILKQFPVGTEVVVTGKVRWKQQMPEVMATDIEKVNVSGLESDPDLGSQTILPVYSETARLSTKVIRNLIQSVMDQVDIGFREILPREDQLEWMERSLAHREIHFPENYTRLAQARARLVWEEILFLQLAVAGLHQGMERLGSPPLLGGEEQIQSFYHALPFKLTMAQQRVIQEIFHHQSQNDRDFLRRLVFGRQPLQRSVAAIAFREASVQLVLLAVLAYMY